MPETTVLPAFVITWVATYLVHSTALILLVFGVCVLALPIGGA